MVDLDRLAPEFAVGIPRALYPLRDRMANWRPFVDRARASFLMRGLDAREPLQGLVATELSPQPPPIQPTIRS
jgi:hypothetical protein